jgi:signal transduction histidine kinase
LQSSLLRHCLRLQRAERDLSTFARQQRPGRELHTGLGQMLAAIRLQLETVAALLPDPPTLVQQALSRISTLANEALEQVRSVSSRLHPPEWQRLTLEAALQQLWDLSGIPQRFEASLRIQPLPHEPDLEVKVLMYRAAQEALSNVVRHARATRVDAALETRDDRMILTIQDDGVGFDVAGLLRGPARLPSWRRCGPARMPTCSKTGPRATLEISPKTVHTYRASLMHKLNVHDLVGLVKFAIERNLTSTSAQR